MPDVQDYGLPQPTEKDAVQALAELVGSDMADGMWNISVRALGLRRPVETVADLRLVAEQLMTTGELVRVAARSLKVRAVTYDALSGTNS